MSEGSSTILAQEKAREQRKLMLWKSRVNLIKKARQLMMGKAFSEAAVAYEKYLRVLEVVFDAQPGELTPEHFKDSARTQELTLVASVYWDLLRIYDTSEKYGERQALAAKKLAQFLKFTPIFPDIVRKAESFSRTARNPGAVRAFVKSATSTKTRCFIATAAFESEFAAPVMALQGWRDRFLIKYVWGLRFIQAYEKLSPPVAEFLDRHDWLKPAVRGTLMFVLKLALKVEEHVGIQRSVRGSSKEI